MFIAIYGRDNCPFCVKAKKLAESIVEADSFYIDLEEQNLTKADLRKIVGKPVDTVPQVFIDGIHIGGFTDFEAHMSQQVTA